MPDERSLLLGALSRFVTHGSENSVGVSSSLGSEAQWRRKETHKCIVWGLSTSCWNVGERHRESLLICLHTGQSSETTAAVWIEARTNIEQCR